MNKSSLVGAFTFWKSTHLHWYLCHFLYVFHFKEKIPPKCSRNSKLEEIIFSWVNNGTAFTRKLTFRLYVILLLRVKIIRIRSFYFQVSRQHLTSSCILIYWILIAPLWSRWLLLSPFDRGKNETQWGYISSEARLQTAQPSSPLIQRAAVLKV